MPAEADVYRDGYTNYRLNTHGIGSRHADVFVLRAAGLVVEQRVHDVRTAWINGQPDAPDAFSGQDYFPEALGRQQFYDPPERGFEREIRKRLEYWSRLRKERSGE